MKKNSLTDSSYWTNRQSNSEVLDVKKMISSNIWLKEINQYLKQKDGGSYLELGCSPGHSSICAMYEYDYKRILGIDFSNESYKFLELMNEYQKPAELINEDIFKLELNEKFDIVSSYGLIEHFDYPLEIVKKHAEFVDKNGYLILVVPHFRNIQYVYHKLFDASDLKRHNTKMMTTEYFEFLAKELNFDIVKLGYFGELGFWNVDLEGSFIGNFSRRIFSRIVREISLKLGKILPKNTKLYSPWIVFVGKPK